MGRKGKRMIQFGLSVLAVTAGLAMQADAQHTSVTGATTIPWSTTQDAAPWSGRGLLVVHYNAGVTAEAAGDADVAYFELRPETALPIAGSPFDVGLSAFVVAASSDGTNLPPALRTIDAPAVDLGEPAFGDEAAAWTLDVYAGSDPWTELTGRRLHTVLYGSEAAGGVELFRTDLGPGEQRLRVTLPVTDGVAHVIDGAEVDLATALAWDGRAFARAVPGLKPGESRLSPTLRATEIGRSSDAGLLTGQADPGFVDVWSFTPDEPIASTGNNCLSLDVVPDQDCFKEDDLFTVELNMSNLVGDVTGFFASVTYDPALLELQATSAYTLVPFPLHILDPIVDTGAPPGTILLDGSSGFGDPGTTADALLATMIFKVLPGNDGVSTSIDFTPGGTFPSELSFEGLPKPTLLVDSMSITIDQTGPSIGCNADVSVSNDPGLCSATVDLATPPAADDCGILSVEGLRSDGLALDDPYPAACDPGNTVMVTWTATDIAGHETSCVQTVTVTDDEGPTLTVPDDIIAYADGGGVSAVIDYPDPVVGDNCDPDPSVDCVPPSGSVFPLGITVVTCTATDECGNTTIDTFSVQVLEQAECFLVIGDGPGNATFFDVNHLFDTQVDQVEDSYPVLQDDIPEFVLPIGWGRNQPPTAGTLGDGHFDATPLGNGPVGQTPAWMQDGEFAVQVLMWNPEVFPSQPEKYTAGLQVSIDPNGAMTATPYGTAQGGMSVSAQVTTNAAGQRVIRFPFLIPGFEP